ncbi:helix-turn-helix domain-containing protein [Streptomyces sp. 184]|uniref:helix-turn-helix domain-containing protein n=1 Tax=Streptomyces sp. 184 TaxID=1827526 RepID=UPI003892672E
MSERRRSLGYSQEHLAERVGVALSTVQRWESGESNPQPWQRPKLARALDVTATQLSALLGPSPACWTESGTETVDDETAAWELARRVNASDVGGETLTHLERAFDELATAYPVTPPQVLLRRVRKHTAYVAQLLDKRATLAERRRLVTVGGWLSLLGATVHVDLDQQDAATARLRTAATLAREAGHREIEAWCYETDAWRVLTAGDYTGALDLSRAAQSLAPAGSSALVQAAAQEGRALARLGEARETYAAVDRVQQMAAAMGLSERPKEHHYQYDPAKALAYTATTLAWLGDRGAEPYAREVIARLSPSDDVQKWPRRVASANIDLALVLLAGGRLDEACDAARLAMFSGRIVPSNHWRAREVVNAAESRKLPGASDLREAYEGMTA